MDLDCGSETLKTFVALDLADMDFGGFGLPNPTRQSPDRAIIG
jgi:hypothetical protein